MEQDQSSGMNGPVLSEWIGYWVFISYLSGPNIDTDEPNKPVRAQPEAVTASFHLENYWPLGLEVKRNLGDPILFMSWSAVLYVQGPPPEAREEIDRQLAEQEEEGNQT